MGLRRLLACDLLVTVLVGSGCAWLAGHEPDWPMPDAGGFNPSDPAFDSCGAPMGCPQGPLGPHGMGAALDGGADG